ncbi:sensor histidine kinase [Eisenbergiella porci]|uniref:sensor histidine kinase n=1 Tax=Eisenbergiella porci TaxID=2652274 RepID=UPI002A80224A|nr:histidine kinase [Eisenbergiella porci]
MKAKKEISTFKRLLSIFLIIIFPIIITGFCAIGFYGKRSEQEALNLVHVQMKYYIEKYEENMQEVQRRTIALLNNKDLQQLANLPEIYSEYEKSRAVLRVQHELDNIKNFQKYIKDVSVVLPRLERTIHAEGYEKGSYTHLDYKELEEIMELNTIGVAGVCNYYGELIMPVSARTLDGLPIYVILVRFSPEEMKKEFSYSVNISDSLFQFLIPEEGFVLDDFPEETSGMLKEYMASGKEDRDTAELRMGHKKWYVFREPVPFLNGIYYKLIPGENIIPATKTLMLLAFLFFSATVVCIWGFFMSAHRLINEPMRDMVAAFREVEKGNFKVRLDGRETNDFGYLYRAFNTMTENLQTSIDKIYNQKMLIQKTELKQLQAQINPHFLYNSYFMLHRLIKKEDYEKAVLLSKEMGTYFRYITRNGRDVVDLEEEDGHARIYAQLQGMRFEGRIRIVYGELPENCRKIQVPRLIIQPILENAFGHGLENKEENGILRVEYRDNGQDIVSLFIEDNGEELSEQELAALKDDFGRQPEEREIQEVTGMVNINRRMKIFYGKGAGLYLSRSELGGLCAELRIPKGEIRENGENVSASNRG